MIVVDTSIVMKWLARGEKYEQEARILVEKYQAGQETIVAPALLYIEVANVLSTKGIADRSSIHDSLSTLYNLNLTIYNPLKEDIISSSLLAYKYNVTVYDMLYAVVAKRHKCNLITADENFVKKTKFPFVKYIGNVKK